MLHPLSSFLDTDESDEIEDGSLEMAEPSYFYEGHCPQEGTLLRLPRTALAEAVARGLMRRLSLDEPELSEGKMFGVLVVREPSGQICVLRAFSGLWKGEAVWDGWVPPIPGREEVAREEQETIAYLDATKSKLIELSQIPERAELVALEASFEAEGQQLRARQKEAKLSRDQRRAALKAAPQEEANTEKLRQLDEESREEKRQRKAWMARRDEACARHKERIQAADEEMTRLKRERKQVSRTLQDRMYAAYRIANFAGKAQALEDFFEQGRLPTGTGDCCAPKLLHYAATHRLLPLGMAEFWWGPSLPNGSREEGVFYEACEERCQPMMGFLLSGLPQETAISENEPFVMEQLSAEMLGFSILYQDDALLVVDKPAGLLAVPGRTQAQQDSVLGRLWVQAARGAFYKAAHRLDMLTSGILVIARHPLAHRELQQQFRERTVQKRYEAILSGTVAQREGEIRLPLWGDPAERPIQRVDLNRGKEAVTGFQVIEQRDGRCHLSFFPHTGRTHQLRVHAADPAGLHAPICGDTLYGGAPASRLCLHACEIRFVHPTTKQSLHFVCPAPFSISLF
ncbi:MAG: RluA family pseudouridine synthase [Myxococcales bacterium]|nr:RluA family pseudouridine synthase [Myxococcales bacterium]